MNTKKDFYLVTVIGFLVGWLVLLPLTTTKLLPVTVKTGALSVIGFSILAPCALWVLKLLSRRWKVFEQFGKFAAVGTLNTLLNFAVLNLFILTTGIAKGWWYSAFAIVAFLVATTNSYFWNKFWTFQSTLSVTGTEYLRFALFTLGGALLNAGAASLIVNVMGAPAGVSANLWANVGGLGGVLASFLWNFLSYKLVVFKPRVTSA